MIVCGEPSGDLHAAELVGALREIVDVRVIAAGGPQLAAAGAEVKWDSIGWGAIGLPEALAKLPRCVQGMREIVAAVGRLQPDMLVLVDFGAFNVRLATTVRRRWPKVPIFYYFPPASWDRSRRDYRKLLQVTDFIATPFPWNAARLAAQGATVRWVGHPAVDRVRPPEDRAAAKSAIGCDPGATVIALLPGSRRLTRRLLGGVFLRAAERLRQLVERLEVVWCTALRSEQDDWALGVGGWRGWARPVFNTAAAMQAADACLCCFGTTTLEAALADCPAVAAYRGTLAMKLVFALMHLPTQYYAMPNIALGRQVVPELVNGEATPERLAQECYRLLRDGEARKAVLDGYAQVRKLMGQPGAARRAAQMVAQALDGRLEPHRLAIR